MRSGSGTKSAEPGFDTFSTKAVIASLAEPLFLEGS
jgi:hypothetical protein